jgi:hypothetical protein
VTFLLILAINQQSLQILFCIVKLIVFIAHFALNFKWGTRLNRYRAISCTAFILSLLLLLSFVVSCHAAEQWSHVFGDSEAQLAYSIIQTSDGGYAVVGSTYHNSGWNSLWLLKLDASGNKQWNQTLDDYANDTPNVVIQTQDGGYAIAGSSQYYSSGYNDFRLIKTDSSGQVQWSKMYGGGGDERAYSFVQTNDGGYALAGSAWSESSSLPTFCLVKVNSLGEEQWTQIYEYSNFESVANSIIITKDGAFALAGYVTLADGRKDFRLVKTDSSGTLQWSQTYGGSDEEIAYSIVQTNDGEYAIAGYVGIPNIRGDFLLIKTDSTGNILWNRQYGGDYEEFGAYSMVMLSDGGFALAGGLGLAEPFYAVRDFLLLRTDSSGVQLWNRTYGGSSDDYVTSMVETSDGAYVLLGPTNVDGMPKLLVVKTEVLETNITPQSSPSPSTSAESSSTPQSSPTSSIPEFPVVALLPLFVALSVVATILLRKKHPLSFQSAYTH